MGSRSANTKLRSYGRNSCSAGSGDQTRWAKPLLQAQIAYNADRDKFITLAGTPVVLPLTLIMLMALRPMTMAWATPLIVRHGARSGGLAPSAPLSCTSAEACGVARSGCRRQIDQ
jgi:hypothetical protein